MSSRPAWATVRLCLKRINITRAGEVVQREKALATKPDGPEFDGGRREPVSMRHAP